MTALNLGTQQLDTVFEHGITSCLRKLGSLDLGAIAMQVPVRARTAVASGHLSAPALPRRRDLDGSACDLSTDAAFRVMAGVHREVGVTSLCKHCH